MYSRSFTTLRSVLDDKERMTMRGKNLKNSVELGALRGEFNYASPDSSGDSSVILFRLNHTLHLSGVDLRESILENTARTENDAGFLD